MIAKPTDSLRQCGRIVRRNDKSRYTVLDNFWHASYASANHRRTTSHPFKKGLSEQFRNDSFFSIHGAIYAWQNNAERTAVGFDQFVVVTIVPKENLLSVANLSKLSEISVVVCVSDQFQFEVARKSLDEIIHTLMGK
jgi:hypothetical protein